MVNIVDAAGCSSAAITGQLCEPEIDAGKLRLRDNCKMAISKSGITISLRTSSRFLKRPFVLNSSFENKLVFCI